MLAMGLATKSRKRGANVVLGAAVADGLAMSLCPAPRLAIVCYGSQRPAYLPEPYVLDQVGAPERRPTS